MYITIGHIHNIHEMYITVTICVVYSFTKLYAYYGVFQFYNVLHYKFIFISIY